MTTASWNFSFFDSLGAAKPGATPNNTSVCSQRSGHGVAANAADESERSEVMAYWARGQAGLATPAWLRKDAAASRPAGGSAVGSAVGPLSGISTGGELSGMGLHGHASAAAQPLEGGPAYPIKPRPVTPFFSTAPNTNTVRVLRVSQAAGRLRICGRMADVCAELERLSARAI